MKLNSITFRFDKGHVHFNYEPHEHEGKKYTYHAHVVREGKEMYWHYNRPANKTNAIRLLRACK